MNVLTVTGISKKDDLGFDLKDINFTQNNGQKIAVAGETGSGKSTLLKIIAGLAQPDKGEVIFEEKKIKGPDEKLIPGHPGIAYLSQHFELRNSYRVEEELSYLNTLTAEAATEIYNICRIIHLLKRWTNQVSGGERQRIALARLLVSSPRLLLLDEPYSNLDLIHKNILKSVIHDIGEKLGITCILVSHDAQDILSWADNILVMRDGQVIEQGFPHQIYQRPANEYTAALFGKYMLLPAETFSGIPSINEKRIFLRPEQLSITKEKGQASGIVKEINFFGSFYEVEVMLSEMLITVQSQQADCNIGDAVNLSVVSLPLWYL